MADTLKRIHLTLKEFDTIFDKIKYLQKYFGFQKEQGWKISKGHGQETQEARKKCNFCY